MNLIRNSNWMLLLWIACAINGAVYLFFFWDGKGSPAFIVGQIALGLIGASREIYLQKSSQVNPSS